MESENSVQILDATFCIWYANTFREGMNPTILPAAKKIVQKINLFKLGMATILEEIILWI